MDYLIDKTEVFVAEPRRIVLEIHQLHGQVDALCGRVCGRDSQDILFAQDGRFAVDEEPRPLVGICNYALPDDETFAGLEFDLEGHDFCFPVLGMPPFV